MASFLPWSSTTQNSLFFKSAIRCVGARIRYRSWSISRETMIR